MPIIKVNDVRNTINNLMTDARDIRKNDEQRMSALAEAYAYWFILNQAGIPYRNAANNNPENNAGQENVNNNLSVNVDPHDIQERKQWALNSDAFKIAQRLGKVNDLTRLRADRVKDHIDQVNQHVNYHIDGDNNSKSRARKIFNQFSDTWRIKWNSSEFNAAKRAMQDIADSPNPPSQVDNYLANETVGRYVTKNINKAKSAVGITRMSCALAFLKQTMSPDNFKIYCANLNGLRGILPRQIQENGDAYDRTNPRAIIADEIGTIDEVYHNARERLTRYAQNDNLEIDTRDIAILTALKNIERNSPEKGNKIVEHETLQAEIKKIQNNREFQNLCKTTPRDELIMMAWEHGFDTTMTPVLNEEQMGRINNERKLKLIRETEEEARNNANSTAREEYNKVREQAANIDAIMRSREIEAREEQREKEEKERLENERTLSKLCVELAPGLEEFAEPAKKKEAEELRKNKPGSLDGILDILDEPLIKKQNNSELDDIFDQLKDNYVDPMIKKVETLAKYTVLGHLFNKDAEKRKEKNYIDTDFTINLADFNKEVEKLQKNPVFVSYAKQTIKDPEFSEKIWNKFKKADENKHTGDDKKKYAVLSYSANLDNEYKKYVPLSKERPLDTYYSTLKHDLDPYMKLKMHDDEKLRKLVAGSLAIREIRKKRGPNAKATQYEMIDLALKYMDDPAVDITMQSLKGISVWNKLEEVSGHKDFDIIFAKATEQLYNKALEDMKKLKEVKKPVKINKNANLDEFFKEQGIDVDNIEPLPEVVEPVVEPKKTEPKITGPKKTFKK